MHIWLCGFIDFFAFFWLWKLARKFGYQQSPPPFLALEKFQYTFKLNILQGVNFASAGSGILKQTGHKQWVAISVIIFHNN